MTIPSEQPRDPENVADHHRADHQPDTDQRRVMRLAPPHQAFVGLGFGAFRECLELGVMLVDCLADGMDRVFCCRMVLSRSRYVSLFDVEAAGECLDRHHGIGLAVEALHGGQGLNLAAVASAQDEVPFVVVILACTGPRAAVWCLHQNPDIGSVLPSEVIAYHAVLKAVSRDAPMPTSSTSTVTSSSG